MTRIQLEFEYPASLERVWNLLTDRTHLATWFMETDFVPEVGRRFMFWPGPGLRAVDGPISAVVLAIAAPTLLMGWQSPTTQSEMTWTLQATPQGTRLLVVESGHVGTAEIARERALAQLFDTNLRNLLERSAVAYEADPAVISDAPGQLAAFAGAADAPAASRSAYSPGAAPVAPAYPALGFAPVGQTYLRGGVWLIAVLSTVVLALVAVEVIWPPTDGSGDALAPGGVSSLGSSPANRRGSPPMESMASSPVVSSPVGGTILDPSGGPPPWPARLTASSTYTSTLTDRTVTATITNDGGKAGQWRSAAVVLGAGDLIVTPIGSEVSQTSHGSTHCFYPITSAASVPAGGLYEFRFTITLGVTDILTGDPVKSVTLDSGAC